MMILFAIWLGALANEAASTWALWSIDSLSAVWLGGILVSHGAAAALMGLAIQSMLPIRYRSSGPKAWLLFFAISFFVPYLGPLGLAFVVVPALHRPRPVQKRDKTLWQELGIPALPSAAPDPRQFASPLGEAGISSLLQNASDPSKRLGAVLATIRLPDKEAVPLLQLALRDSEDDIRLLAYALLDRKEHAIAARLRERQTQLHIAPTDQHLGLHAGIAYDCWELAYLGLAQRDIADYLLNIALEHIQAALELNPNEPGLYLLRGRISLRRRNLEAAADAFAMAKSLGVDSRIIAPYLAEMFFLQKEFGGAREELKGLIQPNRHPPIEGVVEYRQGQVA
jgi:tetratricopeptide (TPR) repeat protein